MSQPPVIKADGPLPIAGMTSREWPRHSWAHTAYIAAIAWKGFDGLLELGGGAIIAILGSTELVNFIQMTAPELEAHLRAIIILHHGNAGITQTARFVSIYLLIHGAVKLSLALALLRERHTWIFPLAIVIFSGFVAYMSYRLTLDWSWWLLAFVAFDVVTIGLIAVERIHHRNRSGTATRR